MFGIGTQELIIVLVILLLIFGPKKLPELARSTGRALNEFRKASSGVVEEEEKQEETTKKEEDKKSNLVDETPEKIKIK